MKTHFIFSNRLSSLTNACRVGLAFVLALGFSAELIASPVQPLPFVVPDKIPDQMQMFSPSAIEEGGFLGDRISKNEKNRLVQVDLEPLLAGFRKKPGVHPWIGEHIGKWMHASTLAWANTGDPELLKHLDYAAAELVKAQESDGYLGTYTPDKRFGLYPEADWDVWSHKYNLMGLLTYYQYTGNKPALEACRKIGDLMIKTFGSGGKSIITAGTHMGMAATSILEPMVLLYRLTGEPRYLNFCQTIVASWDEPNGPKVLETLLKEKSVNKTANGKAYEMLSNLVGLCELARVTGENKYIQAALNAWEDVVQYRLYLTGSTSAGEHFQEDYKLPNQPSASICETCVSTTWIQLNMQLLRLTGESRFGSELEKTFYNHLSAAQRPDGAQWCYYTALEGTKPYGPGINCCVSSGPRGMALAPQCAFFRCQVQGNQPETIIINFLESGTLKTELDGQSCSIDIQSAFPKQGTAKIAVQTEKPARFQILLRIPAWAEPLQVTLPNGKSCDSTQARKGWLTLPITEWNGKQIVQIRFSLTTKVVQGDHGNIGASALLWGPFVLAYDIQYNSALPSIKRLNLAFESGSVPFTRIETASDLQFRVPMQIRGSKDRVQATFVPFAQAGATGSRYQVWINNTASSDNQPGSLASWATESRSRNGNQEGSINDGDVHSYVVTFDGQKADQDWYSLEWDKPFK